MGCLPVHSSTQEVRVEHTNTPSPCRIPITSTGLYKEIAKIGKTAAQPFKNIQLSLNDTFNSLGSLSMPAAAKPGQLVSSLGGSRPRSSGSGAGRVLPRRSQTGKLHHMYSDSVHGVPDSANSLAALVNSMDALQASIKESTSLLRLDLQQHTALLVSRLGACCQQRGHRQRVCCSSRRCSTHSKACASQAPSVCLCRPCRALCSNMQQWSKALADMQNFKLLFAKGCVPLTSWLLVCPFPVSSCCRSTLLAASQHSRTACAARSC